MKEAIYDCNCLSKLSIIGDVGPYRKDSRLSYYAEQDVEEGTICLVSDVIEDHGWCEGFEWKPYLVVEKEYYPIKYCPICGKEIKYKKEKKLIK